MTMRSLLCSLSFSLVALLAAPACAQGPLLPPVEPVTAPVWEKTDAGAPKLMNFGIPLRDISGGGSVSFTSYAKRPLVIFYFSALCPHCQHSYPEVQSTVDRYASRGLTMIAVASGVSNDADLQNFIRERGVHFPMFKDQEKKFSDAYTVGAVPMIVLVKPSGEYIRYRAWSAENQKFMAEEVEKLLAAPAAKTPAAAPAPAAKK